MYFFLSLLILSALTNALSTPYALWTLAPVRTCSTQSPDIDLLTQHALLSTSERHEKRFLNASTLESHITSHLPLPLTRRSLDLSSHHNPYSLEPRQLIPPIFTIDTYFHVVSDRTNSTPGAPGYVTDQMLFDQLAYLTNAYTSVGIAFNLIGITRTENDLWAANGDDAAMKSALRKGTYSTLNVYYQTMLRSDGTDGYDAGTEVLGFCTMPVSTIRSNTPPPAYAIDGCNILAGTLPGSSARFFNLGGTSAHEIGHWNGLLHPFEGTTCDPTNFGDYVADTPQESQHTSGCPPNKDTCQTGVEAGIYDGIPTTTNPYGPAGYSGPDPIHNFMDYSQDSCYEGFTAGQGARMVNLWTIYRMGL